LCASEECLDLTSRQVERLLDLARLAEQATNALDNASAPLPRMLATAASDLEYAYYTNDSDGHVLVGRRILGPVLSRMDTDMRRPLMP
jgi:hypothetical protein